MNGLRHADDVPEEGVFSLYLFWLHYLVPGLILHIIPSLVVPYLIIRYSNLDLYANSSQGGYLSKYMTRGMHLLGLVGAWSQFSGLVSNSVGVIAIGLIIILLEMRSWMKFLASLTDTEDMPSGVTFSSRQRCPTCRK
jgi:hypothetical protein